MLDAKAAYFKTVVDPAMTDYVGEPMEQEGLDAGNAALAAFFAVPPWDRVLLGPVVYTVVVDPEDANDFIVQWSVPE
jgi:hypothetical protein